MIGQRAFKYERIGTVNWLGTGFFWRAHDVACI